MNKNTNFKDIKGNTLYVGDVIYFKRGQHIGKGFIVDKSYQFKKLYFIQYFDSKQLLALNELFIKSLQIIKANKDTIWYNHINPTKRTLKRFLQELRG